MNWKYQAEQVWDKISFDAEESPEIIAVALEAAYRAGVRDVQAVVQKERDEWRKTAQQRDETAHHWRTRAEQAAARLKRCEEQISAAMQKCRQYWNESDIGDAEIHAVLEWVHDCLLAALRPEEEKE